MVTKAMSSVRAGRGSWRTIDIMSAAMIGVVFGVAYWGWSSAYNALVTPSPGCSVPARACWAAPG